MRFKVKKYGDTRVIKRFALFPKKLSNLNINAFEWVWLETVYIFQRVDCGLFGAKWVDVCFDTRDNYLKYKEDKHA